MTHKTVGPLAVEVVADSTGKYCGNALRFDTLAEAKAYGTDLFMRWTAVRSWRVVKVAAGDIAYNGVSATLLDAEVPIGTVLYEEG
jgi:hypothetical protein